MKLPPITASNPYQDLAKLNNLDYSDVLNYVGIIDGSHNEPWSLKAFKNLSSEAKKGIFNFTVQLRKHYGICSQPTLKPS